MLGSWHNGDEIKACKATVSDDFRNLYFSALPLLNFQPVAARQLIAILLHKLLP